VTIKKDLKLAIDKRFVEVTDLLKKDGHFKTITELSESIGILQTNFNDIKQGRRSITTHALTQFKTIYPFIDLNYILTGQGKPYIEKPIPTIQEPDTSYITGKNTRVVAITQDSRGNENIELVQSKAAASYIDNLQEPEFIGKLPKLFIPTGQLQGGTFRGFEVKGNSMEPTLQSGSIVIGRYIDNWTSIKDDWIYIIVTNEAVLVKRCLNRIEARQQLYLKSDNYEYEARNIDITDVREVWFLKAELRYNFKNTGKELYTQVQHLQADLESLKDDMQQIIRKILP
jgi:phage repressor protein C with HTH and peptisase S24 domain